MDRKAQGISINVIVIAALALLVLVVLSFIFLGQSKKVSTEANSCINNGGACTPLAAGASPSDACPGSRVLSYKCENDGDVCCLSIG